MNRPVVAVSQRIDVLTDVDEVRDCLDQRWAEILWQIGLLPVPVPNRIDKLSTWLDSLEVNAVLLTGGGDVGLDIKSNPFHHQRDLVEASLLRYASKNGLPVVGVCRGMQFLNRFEGGRLVETDNHVGVYHQISILSTGESRIVNSYHRWAIDPTGLAVSLEASAVDEHGNIESCSHRTLPWHAVMWHPERETQLHEEDHLLLSRLYGSALE